MQKKKKKGSECSEQTLQTPEKVDPSQLISDILGTEVLLGSHLDLLWREREKCISRGQFVFLS